MGQDFTDKDVRETSSRMMLDFMQMKSFSADPFIVSQGKGIRIKDIDGKEYIDGLSGVFVVGLGHGNQRIIDAVKAQLDELAFAPPLHGTNPRALELTKLVLSVAPEGMGAVKFLSGGSEATESAMKMARQYHQQTGHPRKYKIISRYGAYHGGTMGALSAGGGWERKSVFEPLAVGFIHSFPPNCYRCPFGQSYPDCGITCARLVEQTIAYEDPETVAAVIMEPVSISSAGFCVPPREYYQVLREACGKYNVTLIFDEIITGFGRLGKMFGALYYGTTPDILCVGKGMSSGYAPLSANIIAEKVARAFWGEPNERKEFHHGHTYGGNPVACAAGVAALTQMIEQDLPNHAAEMGARLRGHLERFAEKYEFIGDVRGAGLLQGMEFVKDRATREPFPANIKPGKLMEAAAKRRGLIMRSSIEYIAFAPPLIITADEIDEIAAITEECLAEVAPQLRSA